MKKVLYSDIATGVRQPYTKVTHEWYNSMIIEATNALAKGIVGNNDTDYIALFGCVNSDSPNADISAGAIYQNGIIYLVPAYVNASITNTIVGVLSTTYSVSDPVLFSDGNARYVHEIKTIEFTDAASGSGLFDYADVIFQNMRGSYYPTITYRNSSGTSLGTEVATNLQYYYFNYGSNNLTININMSMLNSLASTKSIEISLPPAMPTLKSGTSYVGYNFGQLVAGSGTIYDSIVSINLTSTGSGTGLEFNRTDATNYNIIANYGLRTVINITII